MALCFIEPELLPMEVLHCRNSDCLPLCSCDFDLDPITFIYLFDLYYLEIYLVLDVQILTSYVKALKSYCHTQTVKQKNRETELKLYTTPLCKWSISYLFCFSFSFCFSHNCTN